MQKEIIDVQHRRFEAVYSFACLITSAVAFGALFLLAARPDLRPDPSVLGTINTIPKYVSATSISNSSITDNGTTVTFGEPLALGTNKATSSYVPVSGNDLTNKTYVDAHSGSGTVTSVTCSTGLTCTPNPIVSTGSVAITNTAVTPGSYTNANITVDAQGRLTAAASGSSSSVAIGGTVTGGTDKAILFISPAATLAQDPTRFQWDSSVHQLNIGANAIASPIGGGPYAATMSTAAPDVVAYMWGSTTSSYSALGFLDNSQSGRTFIGYGNSAVGAGADFQSKSFISTISSDLYINDSGGGVNRVILGMAASSVFVEMKDGSSAATSASGTGRLRYNNTSKTWQESLDNGTYTSLQAIGGVVKNATSKSVLFIDSSGQFAQDNSEFQYMSAGAGLPSLLVGADAVTKAYGYPFTFTSALAADGVGAMWNTNATGYADVVYFKSDGATFGVAIGYGNASASITSLRGKSFFAVGSGVDVVFNDLTNNNFTFFMTAGSVGLQMTDGASGAVGAAGTAKLRYNAGTNHLEVSLNGGAFQVII